MTKQEFLSLIEEMLEADPGSLAGDEPLDSLPWDSLAVVSFIALADEHLGVAVSPQALAQASSLADVMALVAGHLD